MLFLILFFNIFSSDYTYLCTNQSGEFFDGELKWYAKSLGSRIDTTNSDGDFDHFGRLHKKEEIENNNKTVLKIGITDEVTVISGAMWKDYLYFSEKESAVLKTSIYRPSYFSEYEEIIPYLLYFDGYNCLFLDDNYHKYKKVETTVENTDHFKKLFSSKKTVDFIITDSSNNESFSFKELIAYYKTRSGN